MALTYNLLWEVIVLYGCNLYIQNEYRRLQSTVNDYMEIYLHLKPFQLRFMFQYSL